MGKSIHHSSGSITTIMKIWAQSMMAKPMMATVAMVFMPVMSSYVISDTLSEGKITLFGNYIYLDFSNSMWNEGSFMALIMLVIVGVSMFLTRNVDRSDAQVRGGGLW